MLLIIFFLDVIMMQMYAIIFNKTIRPVSINRLLTLFYLIKLTGIQKNY